MEIKYFDHAATTAVDKKVLETMIPYFSENYGNPSSLYSIGKTNKEIINIYRMKIANILNCKVNEIYFTSCGSESDNLILKGIAFANKNYGNHIITTQIEHPAILETCKYLEKFGFRVTYLKPNSNGIIDINELERSITRNTILISVMFANNEIGTIQPIKEIGEIAKKYKIYFHTDAVQAMGNINIDVKKYNIGALSMSAHKFYGPKGVGVAYINENIPFIRIQDGGHQEKNKRAGTENVAGIVGLGKAWELANVHLKEHRQHLKELRDYYIEQVQEKIEDARLNGSIENRLPGNANFAFPSVDGEALLLNLDAKGICASAGSACTSASSEPSHVLASIGLSNELAHSSLRVTFGEDNTKEDVDYLVENLCEVVQKLRD